jgi:hypothetical protein
LSVGDNEKNETENIQKEVRKCYVSKTDIIERMSKFLTQRHHSVASTTAIVDKFNINTENNNMICAEDDNDESDGNDNGNGNGNDKNVATKVASSAPRCSSSAPLSVKYYINLFQNFNGNGFGDKKIVTITLRVKEEFLVLLKIFKLAFIARV